MPSISDLVRALPKVQLHCHLEGSMQAATFRRLAAQYGVESVRAIGPLEATYAFADFGEFLLAFAEACRVLRGPEDYASIARDYARDAATRNVPYAEVFISPSVWSYFHRDLDVREAVEAIRAALETERARGGPEVSLICDLTRNFGPERAMETARIAVQLATARLGVVGIGLGGDETKYPPELYAGAFAYARANGLHCVAHAGEAAGPESVRGAIDVLLAERIGHGVRAVEDPALVTELAARRIPLEICPTSNALTGAAPRSGPHPIAELDAAGVLCVLDADDPTFFGTSVDEEYALVESWLGPEAVTRFARNAIDASFAHAERKNALHVLLDAALAQQRAGGSAATS
ncbi:MAG: adenosine deaminase [Candidatus Eremiobacteraeota bacterium]|nr:adenosine deaminase [Candidatus Eremiobacteraeota bacterium]